MLFMLNPLFDSFRLDFDSPAVEEEILFKESASCLFLSDKEGGDGISQLDKFLIPSLTFGYEFF